MDYWATGTHDDGSTWNIHVTADGVVTGDPVILTSLNVLHGQSLPLSPTGPQFTFDKTNPVHVRHFLLTVYSDVEEYGALPHLMDVPTVPPGTVG